jgi:signal transduction histidine kinase/CheY-like chemotaxis protein
MTKQELQSPEHLARIQEFRQKRQPSSRARELAMAAVALSGVSLGMWILALGASSTGATLLAVVLTLLTTVLTYFASREFKNLSTALKALRSDNEHLSDRLWEFSESEERASDLFDQLGDLVVLFDARNSVAACNQNFANALGKVQSAIVGETLHALGINVPRDRSSPKVVPVDILISGRWYSWIELRSVPVSGSKTPLFRAVARDVHQRKESEAQLVDARQKAEAANLAKSQFLATVSHEIRTPLNGIAGMSRLLADTSLTQEQKTYVDAVTSSGAALMTLIEDLLDFSKIEAGRMDLRPEKIELRSFTEGLVELVAHRALSKNIGLAVWVAPNVPEVIIADADRLRQAVLNLLGNAIKFTNYGGVSLEVTVERSSLVLCIHDTGRGIEADDIGRIFEQFEQVDGGTTRQHAGVGLGLAITRKLVSAMGGEVLVASKVGKGSAFSIHLPLLGARESRAAQPLSGMACMVALSSLIEAETLAKIIRSNGGMTTVLQGSDLPQRTGDDRQLSLLVDVRTMRRMVASGADFKGFKNRVILIEPGERGSMAEFHQLGFETYLVRPVRQKTLVRLLSGQALAAPSKKHMHPSASSVKSDNKSLSILVAEDNEINALMVKSALMRAGHSVMVVGDGRSAVNEINARPDAHDLILMDLHMPVMDGLDAIAAIRNSEDEHGRKPVPILALTADGRTETEKAVRSVGGNGYVTKPVDPARLVGLIEETAAA